MNSNKRSEIKVIYKYFTINELLFMSLINHELYFCNPTEFNDPYDSTPRFELTQNKGLVLKYYNFLKDTFNSMEERANQNRMVGDNLSELYEIFMVYKIPDLFEQLWNNNPTKLQITLYKHFQFILCSVHKFGVLCGSTKPDCPLMWSHYGNNHKGICIEFSTSDSEGKTLFDFEKFKDSTYMLTPVHYTDKPINFFRENLPTEDGDVNTDILRTKSSKWEYENEIRYIIQKQGLVKFNPNCLNQIIFGARTTPKEKYTICSLIGRYFGLKNKHTTFKKASLLFDEYNMSIENITLEDIAGSGVTFEELNLKPPF